MSDAPMIQKAAEIASRPFDFRHPLEQNAEIRIFPLSHASPLKQTGVSLAHLAPGKCSYPQHAHWSEDEWIYILSGTATLKLDDAEHPVGPGDFAAFPAGGAAHKLTNTGTETLAYLMGGETRDSDIVDFPEQGVRMVRKGTRVETGPASNFAPFDFFARENEGTP